MVGAVAAIELTERLWKSIGSRTKLPCDAEEYFAPVGIAGTAGESRRQYLRVFMRQPAVFFRGEQCHAIYTKDASPKGIALLTPVQIFPTERIKLVMGKGAVELDLKRCRRVSEDCYECGTVFAEGVIPPAMYIQLIHSHGRRQ
jgi:hypothetical protein